MFCILVIGDLLSFKVPLPLLLYLRGGGILQERYGYHNDPVVYSISNLPNLQKLQMSFYG
jgi:hypothetical protein